MRLWQHFYSCKKTYAYFLPLRYIFGYNEILTKNNFLTINSGKRIILFPILQVSVLLLAVTTLSVGTAGVSVVNEALLLITVWWNEMLLVWSFDNCSEIFCFPFSCKDDIPLAVLLTFCSEGDNISDAVNLFLYLNDWLKMVPRKEVCKHTYREAHQKARIRGHRGSIWGFLNINTWRVGRGACKESSSLFQSQLFLTIFSQCACVFLCHKGKRWSLGQAKWPILAELIPISVALSD